MLSNRVCLSSLRIHRNEGKIMNEKTLLILCYLITTVFIIPFKNRLSKRWFVLSILFIPIVVYVFLIAFFVALALLYGDR